MYVGFVLCLFNEQVEREYRMTDQELADKLAEILFYNELSEKAKNVIDNAYIALKENKDEDSN